MTSEENWYRWAFVAAFLLFLGCDKPTPPPGVRGAKMQKDGSVLPGDIITAVDGKPVENAPLRPGV